MSEFCRGIVFIHFFGELQQKKRQEVCVEYKHVEII